MIRVILACLFFIMVPLSHADINHMPKVKQFVQYMIEKHNFEKRQLQSLFEKISINESVLSKIASPYEAKPWYIYKRLFITQDNLTKGLAFWHKYETTLTQAQQRFGIPPHIIVALLGVETKYGERPGNYRIFEALASLAFDYPPRAQFFTKELEQYLLLTKEKNLDPLSLHGSYAGAIGVPQFMPSSYRHYAIDFSGQGKVDLQRNTIDAIGSVANYLHQHGWQKNQPIVTPAKVVGHQYQKLKFLNQPKHTLARLAHFGVSATQSFAPSRRATLIKLENQNHAEYWLGFHNFYVITTYNTSPQYAMAVYLLSEQLKAHYHDK